MDEEEILVNPLDNLDDLETATPTPEVEEDNSEESIDQDQEGKETPEKETPKEPTAKELRHQQQEEGRLAEVQRLRGMVIDAEVAKASNDAKSLLDLHDKDPKLAEEVAKKFGYADFKDAKKQITAWDEPEVVDQKEQFETWYQERKAKEDHETALVEAQAIISQLPEDLQEEAIEEFNDLIDGKVLTKEKALKYANMVSLSVQPKSTPKVDTTEWLKKLSTTGITTAKKVSKDTPQMVIFNGEEILLDSKQTN